MRKEIVELEQLLEIQRLQNMAWWETSDQYQEELEASEEVREEYEEMLKELSPELCAIWIGLKSMVSDEGRLNFRQPICRVYRMVWTCRKRS